MNRASLTVELADGVSRDANALLLGRRYHEGLKGDVSTLTFLCSGTAITVDASEVRSVKFFATGASWCPQCDQSLYAVVGAGAHANPPAKLGRE